MSVLIKHNNVYKLLIKGADSSILASINNKVEQPYEEITKK